MVFKVVVFTPVVMEEILGQVLVVVVERIELRDVHFAYPSRRELPVYQGLSLTIEAGQTVALAGPSGCGKSTVVALLERFYDPKEGALFLDGVAAG